MLLHLRLESKCLNMCEALSVVKCSRTLVEKCRLVLRTDVGGITASTNIFINHTRYYFSFDVNKDKNI